jgi:hypothetical protein
MARYTVYRTYVSGRDGEATFDDLKAAEQDFDDAKSERTVVSAELIDAVDFATIARFEAPAQTE